MARMEGRNWRGSIVVAALALATLGAACENSGNASSLDQGGSNRAALPFGEAVLPGEAQRTIEVTTLDSMRFDPMEIELQQGETVLFKVTNEGKIPHEFALGDEAGQRAHAKEMEGMGLMPHDHPYSVWVDPGQTKEIAWRFSLPGDFLYGCHLPGHYEAGMVGSLSVD